MPLDSTLTTREVSVALWSGAAFVWAVTRPGVASHIPGLLASFVKLAWVWLALSVYVLGLVAGLATVELWDWSLLKETLIWFGFSAVAYPMQFASAGTSPRVIPVLARDSLSALILIEVLIESYTFSLPFELVLVPVMTMLSLLVLVGQHHGEYHKLSQLLMKLQAVAGLTLASIALSAAATDPGLSPLSILREVSLPVVLTFGTLPFILWLRFVFAYDEMVRRVGWRGHASGWFRHYAAMKIMLHLRLRPTKVRPFLHRNGMDLHRIADRAALESMLACDHDVTNPVSSSTSLA